MSMDEVTHKDVNSGGERTMKVHFATPELAEGSEKHHEKLLEEQETQWMNEANAVENFGFFERILRQQAWNLSVSLHNDSRLKYLLTIKRFFNDGKLPPHQCKALTELLGKCCPYFETPGPNPALDAKLFRDGILVYDSVFTVVYGLSWVQVLKYQEDLDTLSVLEERLRNPSATNQSPVPSDIEKAFQAFVSALDDTGCPPGYLNDTGHPATIAYNEFWAAVDEHQPSVSDEEDTDEEGADEEGADEGGSDEEEDYVLV